jgi:hypothetical protein
MIPTFSSAELIPIIQPVIYTQGPYLVYVVKFPLVLETKFNLYKVTTFRVVMSKCKESV